MGERLVSTISTGRIVPMLQRIESDEIEMTKFVLHFQEEEPPVVLLFSGLGDHADHAWWALELVARAFDPHSDVIKWTAEREIAE